MSEAQKIAQNRPDVKARNTASNKERWKDPELRERHREICRIVQNRPEVIEKRNAAVRKALNHPEYKKNQSTILQKFHEEHPGFNAGENHSQYIEDRSHVSVDGDGYPLSFVDIQESIRDRDGRCCVECNKSEEENGQKMSVHHIDEDRENSDPNNLVSLCRACHAKLHGFEKPIYEY